MKKIVVIVMILKIMHMHGYCKFRCADYMKMGDRTVCSSILNKITPHHAAAHYTLEDAYGMCYVYLSSSDKKRVIQALSRYESSSLITQELIQEFSPSVRGKRHIIGLVLQDFATLNKNKATVQDVLQALKTAQ